ncbi:MAG TPA: 1-acyl-sn-glycerol-3-phosphate acyltransferase [Spirochaetia bacterium]|nr:1-acyl-sn-glycerol-3-phosphate acyltransferase [Spirochaetia bacterium]
MISISKKYRDIALKMVESSTHPKAIGKHNVFQPGNETNRQLVDQIVRDVLLPGSRIEGFEYLQKLYELAESGKSCLILMEHYSNFDLPCFVYLANKQGEAGHEVTENLVAVAGMKLNVESEFVLAFAEAYSRIVIYPSRALDAIEDSDQLARERKTSNAINRAALHEMVRQKHSGKLILVFPAGTRYRPGVESTKRGVREIDSYIKSFHYMIMVGIAGNVLRISASEAMSDDLITEDVMVYRISPVIPCHDYRRHTRTSASASSEKIAKQHVADTVMSDLEKLHDEAEALRVSELVHRQV